MNLDYRCDYQAGSGFGGSQYYIGQKFNDQKCADDCFQMVRSNPNVNGASFNIKTKGCICESQMRGRERSHSWKSCLFRIVLPSTKSLNLSLTTSKPIRRTTTKKKRKNKNKNRNKNKRRKNKRRKKNKKHNKTTVQMPKALPATITTTTTTTTTTTPITAISTSTTTSTTSKTPTLSLIHI